MSQGRFRSFFTGALIGAGLGILLAPKEGSETRKDLRKSFAVLVDTIKDIDMEETKALLLKKVKDIKDGMAQIDSTSAKELAQEKISMIEEKCNDLIEVAKENKAVVVEKAATEVKSSVNHLLNEFLEELEANTVEEVPVKEVKKEAPKKKVKKSSTTTKNKSAAKKKTTPKKKTTKK